MMLVLVAQQVRQSAHSATKSQTTADGERCTTFQGDEKK